LIKLINFILIRLLKTMKTSGPKKNDHDDSKEIFFLKKKQCRSILSQLNTEEKK